MVPSNVSQFFQAYWMNVPMHPSKVEHNDNPLKSPADITNAFEFLVYAFKDKTYTGHWLSQSPLLDFFDGQYGYITIEIEKYSGSQPPNYLQQEPFRQLDFDPPSMQLPDDEVTWALAVKIYDGEYIDQKSLDLLYKIRTAPKLSLDFENSKVSAKEDQIDVYLKQGAVQTISTKTCTVDFNMKFVNGNNRKPWKIREDLDSDVLAYYEIKSQDCGFYIRTDTLTSLGSTKQEQIYIYCSLLSIVGMIKILGALKLGNSFNKKTCAFKMSIGTLWAIATFDYYILVLNMLFVFAYSGLILVPTAIYMILSFYVERRLILKCLQRRGTRGAVDGTDEFRSCGFYFIALALLFILELIFILSCNVWIIYISALIFVPQIVHNFRKGKNYEPNFWLLILLGIPRLSIVLYAKYYPQNIFRLSPDLSFIITYSVIFFLQILLLFIQIKWPTFGIRHKNRRPSRIVYEDDLCSICMGHLAHPSCDSEGSLLQRRPTIETVCSHVFHKECLRRWVSNKVECPVCRGSIEDTVEDLESADENIPPPGALNL